ncbi:MAG: hypothetical protein SF066_06840 [Thermoanaerobaculia bacterium]|nr:hypothetical protein [Thermoanaerobaculia bacterium]
MTTTPHPWLLTAPWYRWSAPGVPAAGRGSAPVIQKYGAPSFVTEFLAEPQKSLLWTEADQVHRVEVRNPRPKFSLSPLVRVPTDRRKLFLDIHSRFYLVVVELHCDQPGLPAVTRDQIASAGFVVRRRVAPAGGVAKKALSGALGDVQALESQLAHARGFGPRRRRRPGLVAHALVSRCEETITRLEGELEAKRLELRELAAAHGVQVELQGWVASEHAGFGAWLAVPETPEKTLTETTFPLYPLIPDPAQAGHSARGRTLYFGVVPTGPGDLDAAGNPRFDDRSLYEIRCFVRRPKSNLPGKDCPGDYVWSRPTESYQLAPAADLDGTSHKPVTFTLPDLQDLEAQAAANPAGHGAGVRMVAPANSTLNPDPNDQTKGSRGALPQICSFSIPLITIIATFVLKLFLPIVVFAFGLWWMLKLKLCILPSFEMDADLAFSLEVQPPELDISIGLSVEVDAALGVNLGTDGLAAIQADLDNNQRAGLALELGADHRATAPPDVAAEFPPAEPGYPEPKVPLPAASAGLDYYPIHPLPAGVPA